MAQEEPLTSDLPEPGQPPQGRRGTGPGRADRRTVLSARETEGGAGAAMGNREDLS